MKQMDCGQLRKILGQWCVAFGPKMETGELVVMKINGKIYPITGATWGDEIVTNGNLRGRQLVVRLETIETDSQG